MVVALELRVCRFAEALEVGVGPLFKSCDDDALVGLREGVVVSHEQTLLFTLLAWLVFVEQTLHKIHMEVHVDGASDRFFIHVSVPLAVVLET